MPVFLSAVGIVLGVAISFAFRNVIASELYGTGATDPWVFAGVPVMLAGVATMAAFLASRRALRVDPILALRAE
jgi:putative ABC transport system permease protein